MKKTDIAMIILIASVSVLVSYFAGKALLGDPKEKTEKVRTAESISSEVTKPDAKIFNKDAINPTVEVYIGNANAASDAKENSTTAPAVNAGGSAASNPSQASR